MYRANHRKSSRVSRERCGRRIQRRNRISAPARHDAGSHCGRQPATL